MKCKILDYFKTSIGDIYIIKFDDDKFIPTVKLKLEYYNKTFIITSLSWRSHEYAASEPAIENVWSCKLRSEDNSEFLIPVGSSLVT